MNRKMVWLVALVLAGLAIVACNAPDPMIGRWELVEVLDGPSRDIVHEFELFSDGTGIMEGVGLTWSRERGRIIITTFGFAQAHSYELSDSRLTIIYDERTNHRAIYRRVNR